MSPRISFLQLQHIFSPTTVDEVKFGINRANYHNWSYGTSPVAVSFGSNFDGVSGTSLDTEVGTTFSYIDNLTLVRGRHTLKAGVEIRRIRLNNSGNTLTTSSISYATTDRFHQQQRGIGHLPPGRRRGRQPPHLLPWAMCRTTSRSLRT